MTYSEIIHFQCCRNLDGSLHLIDLYRRNGVWVPNFSKATNLFLPDLPEATAIIKPTRIRGLFQNLTKVERRTWRRILNCHSISEIAEAEGVSRAAVYERIRGNSKGKGGMVAKNPWVRKWWELRSRKYNHEQHH